MSSFTTGARARSATHVYQGVMLWLLLTTLAWVVMYRMASADELP